MMTLTITSNTYKITNLPLSPFTLLDGATVIQNLQNCIKIITENLKDEAGISPNQCQRTLLWKAVHLNREAIYNCDIALYKKNRLEEVLYNLIFVTPTNYTTSHFTFFDFLPKELKTNYLIPMLQTDVSKMISVDRKGDQLIRDYALKLGYKNINNPGKYLTYVLRGWKLLVKEEAFQTSISMLFSLSDKIRNRGARGSLEDLIELKEILKNNEIVIHQITSNLIDFCSHIFLPQGSDINNKHVVLCCMALGVNTKGLVHLLTRQQAFDLAEMVLKEGESQLINECFIGLSPPLVMLVGHAEYLSYNLAYTPEQMLIAKFALLSLAKTLLDHGAHIYETIGGMNVLTLAQKSGCPELIEMLENHHPPCLQQ